MKIERFNENYNLTEPWTEDKFKKIEIINKEITYDLLPLLTKFIIINKDIVEEECSDFMYDIDNNTYVMKYDYSPNLPQLFEITFKYNKKGEIQN